MDTSTHHNYKNLLDYAIMLSGVASFITTDEQLQ